MLAFHGVGAYRGQRNPLSLKRMLDGVIGAAVCGADRPIGAFGAVVVAPYAVAFPRDVWSEMAERDAAMSIITGRETPDQLAEITGHSGEISPRIVDTTDGLKSVRKDAVNLGYVSPRSYSELWMEPIGIRALWVKDWTSDKVKQAAKIMAKHRALPLIEVSGRTRIWELGFSSAYSTGPESPTLGDIFNSAKGA